jgi:hypothetical protein
MSLLDWLAASGTSRALIVLMALSRRFDIIADPEVEIKDSN